MQPNPLSLYPTFDSLDDVTAYAQAQLPINTVNELMSVLGVYHNTLLKEFNSEE